MIKKKKGQGALEFIMTYGWALLVGIIVIGSLWFFFGFDKAAFVTEHCLMGPGFYCPDVVVDEGSITILTKNVAGKDFDSFYFSDPSCQIESAGEGVLFEKDEEKKFTVTGCDLNAGDVYDSDPTMLYSFSGSSIDHNKAFSILGVVAPGNSQAFGGGGSGSGGTAADGGTVLLYNFDEGDGNVVTDESGNGNDGTHYGNTVALYHFDGDVKDESGKGNDGEMNNFDNTILLMNFDDGSGPVANDESVYDNDGTLEDGPVWVSGVSGNALEFDGVNDRVHVSHPTLFDYTGGAMTISTWLYIDSAEFLGYFISKPWNGAGKYNYEIRAMSDPSRVEFLLFEKGNALPSTPKLTVNVLREQWVNVVVVLDGSSKTIEMYVDGVPKDSETHTIEDYIPTDGGGDLDVNLAVGTLYPYGSGWPGVNDHAFDGKIDEVAIYSRAFSASDVLDHFNSGKAKFAENFVDGVSGKGLVFDGVDDYVDVGTPDLGITNAITAEAWIYPRSSDFYRSIVGNWKWNTGGWLLRLNPDGKLLFSFSDGNDDFLGTFFNSVCPNFTLNKWTHVAGVWDGSEVRCYVDGVKGLSDTMTTFTKSTENVKIGFSTMNAGQGNVYFDGMIDDVRISNFARYE